MEVKYYPAAKEFLFQAEKYLVRDEARYGLILGGARFLVLDPHRYGKDLPWFCSIVTGDEINAVAMRTPPYNILVAYLSGDTKIVAEKLVTAVSESFESIPGVVGDKELTDRFAESWCREHNTGVRSTMAQRIFRLEKVNNIPEAPGGLRPATIKDNELVSRWSHAFMSDTFGDAENRPETDVTTNLTRGNIFLWEDGQPVSMALKTRPSDKGMTIGAVYTPPEFRCRGYATSCVAGVCRHILQSGYEFCMLYADLANPTSNSIYKKIGFKEVCDSVEYMFETA